MSSLVSGPVHFAQIPEIPPGMSDTTWKASAKVVQLTIHPSKPTREAEARVSVMKKQGINALHSIRSFRQDVSHKLLVLRFPSSHVTIGAYDPLDIALDVFFLSALLV